jgi:hypothetical protein
MEWKRAKSFAQEAAKGSQTLASSVAISDLVFETTKKSKDLAAEASKKADQIKAGGKGGVVSSLERGKGGHAFGGSFAGGGVVEFDVAVGVGGKGREESVDVGTVDAIFGEESVCTELVEVILGSYMNMERNKKGREKGFLLLYVCARRRR